MENDHLVTAIRFVYPNELGIPRSLLESEGIECFVRDELTISVDPFYSNAIGGIKLQVRESDAQRATDILTKGGFINENRKETCLETKAETRLSDGSTCPYCSSAEVVRKNNFSGKIPALASILSTIVISQPIVFFRKTYHCMDCGKDFRKAGHKAQKMLQVNYLTSQKSL